MLRRDAGKEGRSGGQGARKGGARWVEAASVFDSYLVSVFCRLRALTCLSCSGEDGAEGRAAAVCNAVITCSHASTCSFPCRLQ